MTPNEARGKEDMNPSSDPLADELWMPTGNIPLSKFDEYLSKNQGNQAEPKQLPAPQPPKKQNILKITGGGNQNVDR